MGACACGNNPEKEHLRSLKQNPYLEPAQSSKKPPRSAKSSLKKQTTAREAQDSHLNVVHTHVDYLHFKAEPHSVKFMPSLQQQSQNYKQYQGNDHLPDQQAYQDEFVVDVKDQPLMKYNVITTSLIATSEMPSDQAFQQNSQLVRINSQGLVVDQLGQTWVQDSFDQEPKLLVYDRNLVEMKKFQGRRLNTSSSEEYQYNYIALNSDGNQLIWLGYKFNQCALIDCVSLKLIQVINNEHADKPNQVKFLHLDEQLFYVTREERVCKLDLLNKTKTEVRPFAEFVHLPDFNFKDENGFQQEEDDQEIDNEWQFQEGKFVYCLDIEALNLTSDQYSEYDDNKVLCMVGFKKKDTRTQQPLVSFKDLSSNVNYQDSKFPNQHRGIISRAFVEYQGSKSHINLVRSCQLSMKTSCFVSLNTPAKTLLVNLKANWVTGKVDVLTSADLFQLFKMTDMAIADDCRTILSTSQDNSMVKFTVELVLMY